VLSSSNKLFFQLGKALLAFGCFGFGFGLRNHKPMILNWFKVKGAL